LDSSIIQGPFSIAPCQTLISRFATFSSLYGSKNRVYPPRAGAAAGEATSGVALSKKFCSSGSSFTSVSGKRCVSLSPTPRLLRRAARGGVAAAAAGAAGGAA
jgi:hypothetical protein